MTGILVALGWLVESVAVGLRALLCGPVLRIGWRVRFWPERHAELFACAWPATGKAVRLAVDWGVAGGQLIGCLSRICEDFLPDGGAAECWPARLARKRQMSLRG